MAFNAADFLIISKLKNKYFSPPFADNNAKCALTLTLSDDSTVTIGVYVNSDYPADVVTFIPATQNDAPLV